MQLAIDNQEIYYQNWQEFIIAKHAYITPRVIQPDSSVAKQNSLISSLNKLYDVHGGAPTLRELYVDLQWNKETTLKTIDEINDDTDEVIKVEKEDAKTKKKQRVKLLSREQP
jgi:hypothetical protein